MNRMDSPFHAVARDLYTNIARAIDSALADDERRAPAAKADLPAGLDCILDGDTYVVLADLPGVKKENLEVVVEGRVCVLTFSREVPFDAAPDAVLLAERRFGSGTRKLRFTDELADEGYSAKLADGVLELRLPKKKLNRACRVTVE